ncbi:MAG TPA: YfiR family protein [Thermodesulfovibrionales bacterium]|nr:YfiR family protein [Thermodesulfovibrionales bacterium]
MRPDRREKSQLQTGFNSALWISSIVLGFMLLTSARPQPASAGQSIPGEYDVKAVFLYNILKFVDWPDKTGRTLDLCILGEDPFGHAFDFIQNKTIGNKKVVVKHVRTQRQIGDCQALFISSSEKEDIEHILRTAGRFNILTAGDTEGFSQKGVILNFYLEEDKLRFEINVVSLRRSGLSISSKVLHLARIIEE